MKNYSATSSQSLDFRCLECASNQILKKIFASSMEMGRISITTAPYFAILIWEENLLIATSSS